MKRQTLTALIPIAILFGALLAMAQPVDSGIPIAGRISMQQGSPATQYRWHIADVNITLDPNNTVLPSGMTAVVQGGDILLDLNPVDLGIEDAVFTYTANVPPPGIIDWKGGTIRQSETVRIVWIKYRVEQSPFSAGFGDVLIDPNGLIIPSN